MLIIIVRGDLSQDMPSEPTVVFASDSTLIGRAKWNFTSHQLTVRLTDASVGLAAGVVLQMRVSGVRTPLSSRTSDVAYVTTFDKFGAVVDGPTGVLTNEIVPGQLSGLLEFNSQTDTPAVTNNVTVSFTSGPTGNVPVGGVLHMILPGKVSPLKLQVSKIRRFVYKLQVCGSLQLRLSKYFFGFARRLVLTRNVSSIFRQANRRGRGGCLEWHRVR